MPIVQINQSTLKKSLMKSYTKILSLACLFFTLTAAHCKKDKDPLSQLPAETQEGNNTLGCLLNGQAYLPKGNGGLNAILTSYYQYKYPGINGYVFQVKGVRDKGNCEFESIFINGDSIRLEQGKTYSLSNCSKGNVCGNYSYAPPNCASGIKRYTTSNIYKGELVIKKFDVSRQIVSGTFWYDLIDSAGNAIQIREGRFDMKYTR